MCLCRYRSSVQDLSNHKSSLHEVVSNADAKTGTHGLGRGTRQNVETTEPLGLFKKSTRLCCGKHTTKSPCLFRYVRYANGYLASAPKSAYAILSNASPGEAGQEPSRGDQSAPLHRQASIAMLTCCTCEPTGSDGVVLSVRAEPRSEDVAARSGVYPDRRIPLQKRRPDSRSYLGISL